MKAADLSPTSFLLMVMVKSVKDEVSRKVGSTPASVGEGVLRMKLPFWQLALHTVGGICWLPQKPLSSAS